MDRWLYLVLLLEFQATVDPAMALRMLAYTTLLYQRLDADGVLRDHRALPPVLLVVLYNGRRPWTAPVEMTDLVAVGSDLLAPYQPSQRYYLLDGARVADADLPADNLVSALIALEKARDAARLREALQALSALLRAQGDDHLTRAFVTWLHQGLRVAGRLPGGEGDPLIQLQETQTMLEENVREWTREWLEQGRAEGVEQGRAQGIEQGIEQGREQGIEQGRALEEIFDYLSRRDAPGRAEHVLERIEQAFQALSAFPERGSHPRELLELGIREYREVFFKPYRIMYRVMGDGVYVLVIEAGRRDMRALLQRRLLCV